jgi:hypothetical protein
MTKMEPNKLIVEITLGNDAMNDPQHVADALVVIAKQISHVIMCKGITTKITDANGNTVGTWSYQ